MLRLDHVIVCVEDLDAGAHHFRERYGLESVEGGRHPGHGTANRIVPLGDAYIELLAVVAPEEAAGSRFGRWASDNSGRVEAVDAVVLRTDDIEALSDRLGLSPVAMSRELPDGRRLLWRLAGLEMAIEEGLPAFIEWGVADDDLPGRAPVSHPGGDARVESVSITGDLTRLRPWTRGSSGVELDSGEPGFRLSVRAGGGLIVL